MKTRITTFIAITFFLISVGLKAQIDRSQQPKPGPAPSINLGKPLSFTLKNGLKVLVVENHKLPKVSAMIFLDNGPIFEGDKAGVSAMASGILGNGTSTISKDAFNEEVDFLGASLSVGSQSARFNSLSKHFSRLMELMADAVQNPLFSQEEFDKQQARLLEGLKGNENNVAAIAARAQGALVYGKNHPYGEFSSKVSVNVITLENVKNFYDTYFKPNNGYFVIIGDVQFKEVKKLVHKYFDKWEKGIIPSYTVPDVFNPPKTSVNFIDMPNAVQSNIAIINSIDFTMNSPDYFACLLANKIFGGGPESRLFLNLREDKKYTYGAYSSISSSQHTVGTFKSMATVRNIVTDSAVVEFLKEIKKFKGASVTETELKNAKAAYIGNFVMALEKPSTAVNYALNIEMNSLPKDFYETYLQKINDVTIEDIQRVANRYISYENTRIVVVGKAIDVLPNLEKLPYDITYYSKDIVKTDKPELTKPIPAGVTISTVLNNYIEAIGGSKVILELKSASYKSSASVQGMAITTETKHLSPNKQAVVMTSMGMVLSKIVFDGENGYTEQQGTKTVLSGDIIDEMKAKSVPFPEVGYLKNKNISLDNIENINGSDAYVVSVDSKTKVYYDVSTGLKVRQVNKDVLTQIVEFLDYKEVSGVLFAHETRLTAGEQEVIFTISDLKFNEGVVLSDFE